MAITARRELNKLTQDTLIPPEYFINQLFGLIKNDKFSKNFYDWFLKEPAFKPSTSCHTFNNYLCAVIDHLIALIDQIHAEKNKTINESEWPNSKLPLRELIKFAEKLLTVAETISFASPAIRLNLSLGSYYLDRKRLTTSRNKYDKAQAIIKTQGDFHWYQVEIETKLAELTALEKAAREKEQKLKQEFDSYLDKCIKPYKIDWTLFKAKDNKDTELSLAELKEQTDDCPNSIENSPPKTTTSFTRKAIEAVGVATLFGIVNKMAASDTAKELFTALTKRS